jgi:hypothetical protein
MIEIASRWRRVWLQLNACYTHVAAIQCRISDPLPQLLVMAQGATNFQSKVPGVRINKTWRYSAISTMTMNERHIVLTHFPRLLNDFFSYVRLHNFGGVITVEVHFDHLDHTRLYARRQERAATWDVSEFYEQSSIGATWKYTATRDIFVVLLRVVIGTGVVTSETIDCWPTS